MAHHLFHAWGPTDLEVNPSYSGQIAVVIWEVGEHGLPIIECMPRKLSPAKLVETREHMITDAKNVLIESMLFAFLTLMFEHINHTFIVVFVKRWQPDTNIFYVPFGEIIIMLHVLENILVLSVSGTLSPCPSIEEWG